MTIFLIEKKTEWHNQTAMEDNLNMKWRCDHFLLLILIAMTLLCVYINKAEIFVDIQLRCHRYA